jgi:hypothetical protein
LLVLGLQRCLVNGVRTKKLIHQEKMWFPSETTSLRNHSAFPSHIFRVDGILEVNPDAQHPIIELFNRAEARWQAKLDRASQTLEEAINEYIRRYRRDPPKGFDAWWALFWTVVPPVAYYKVQVALC